MTTPVHILLVEDEPTIAVTLTDDLEHAGFAVTHTPLGLCALALVASGSFDVVITDLRLPDIDGARVVAAVRRCTPAARSIVITALLADRLAELQRAGADVVFTKPFANEQVLAWLCDGRLVAG